MSQVRGHYRSDGSYVRPHTRRQRPGSERQEMREERLRGEMAADRPYGYPSSPVPEEGEYIENSANNLEVTADDLDEVMYEIDQLQKDGVLTDAQGVSLRKVTLNSVLANNAGFRSMEDFEKAYREMGQFQEYYGAGIDGRDWGPRPDYSLTGYESEASWIHDEPNYHVKANSDNFGERVASAAQRYDRRMLRLFPHDWTPSTLRQ